MPKPKSARITFSIVIVTYNGYPFVKRCIESIIKSKTPSLEIIIVDNGSSDGSVKKLQSYYKNKINIISLDKNYGPAKARNEGALIARGEFLGFLDNDTVVHKNWAKNALKEFKKNKKIGIIQCKLLLSKERNRLDYVGEYIGSNGFLIQRAKTGEIDTHQYDQPVEILAAKSAGMFIRKNAFDAAGGFDEDYFIYVEETDLGWRSWLKGYHTIFIPQSIVYHEFGTSTIILGKSKNNYNAKFHGSKNYILTLFKNLGTVSLFKILPLHILLWGGLAIYSFFKGEFKNGGWILQGIGWNIIHIMENVQKRRRIQQGRVITDEKLFPIIMKKRPFSYFLFKAIKKHRIGNAESF